MFSMQQPPTEGPASRPAFPQHQNDRQSIVLQQEPGAGAHLPRDEVHDAENGKGPNARSLKDYSGAQTPDHQVDDGWWTPTIEGSRQYPTDKPHHVPHNGQSYFQPEYLSSGHESRQRQGHGYDVEAGQTDEHGRDRDGGNTARSIKDADDDETDKDTYEESIKRLSWRQRMQHVTWAWFTLTMATGGIANVLHNGRFLFSPSSHVRSSTHLDSFEETY
jgi:hypothetical protein